METENTKLKNENARLIRNLSTPDTALYVAMKKKAIKALEEIKTLKLFTGTLIHDHENALYHFGTEHGGT